MNIGKLGAVALVATGLMVSAPAFAKHHSNTISKIAHTLSYSARKAGHNVSVNTHRALGHNSVEHRKYGHYRRNVVITPGGHIKPVMHNGHPSHFVPAHKHMMMHHNMMHHHSTPMHHNMMHHHSTPMHHNMMHHGTIMHQDTH